MPLRSALFSHRHSLPPASLATDHSSLATCHSPLATTPSRFCSFHLGRTRPNCEPSSFPQLALSGYFAQLAGSSDRADQFPCVNEHTPRAASRPERGAGLHLIPNWKRPSARSRHTQFTARLPDPCGRLRKVVSS